MKSLTQSQNLIRLLFQEDQNDRRPNLFEKFNEERRWRIIAQRDRERRKRLKQILKQKPKLRGVDWFRAGIIFQHGSAPADIRTARRFAERGMRLNARACRWLYAAATDRLLMMKRKSQKFGTQFRARSNGTWQLHPVDPRTTDRERAVYSVKPLRKLQEMARALEQNRKRSRSSRIGLSRF